MDKREKRRITDKKIIKKRIKLLKVIPGNELFLKNVEKEPGRLRDRHPFDCGNPKCQLCHSYKIFGNRGKKKIKPTGEDFDERPMPGDFEEEDFH
jgi:hypothetical protein